MAESRAIGRLFVLAGPDVARTFDVEERALLGRSEECDVRLRHRSISRKHALLARSEAGWFLQDLGSTNGVAKDGERVERLELKDGDEFELGDLPLRFRLVARPAAGEELDFAPGPVASATAPAPGSKAPRSPAGKPEPARPAAAAAADEIEIGEEIEIGGTDALAATSFSAPRPARRTGLFSGELEQHPFWLRSLIVLVVLSLAAGLCFAAFQAVAMLRSAL